MEDRHRGAKHGVNISLNTYPFLDLLPLRPVLSCAGPPSLHSARVKVATELQCDFLKLPSRSNSPKTQKL